MINTAALLFLTITLFRSGSIYLFSIWIFSPISASFLPPGSPARSSALGLEISRYTRKYIHAAIPMDGIRAIRLPPGMLLLK